MKSDLLKQTESIAARLVLNQNDAVTRCRAEQDIRALAFGSFLRAVGVGLVALMRGLAGAVSHALSTQRYGERLQDDNSPALR